MKSLVEKYFLGETSLAEEALIREYFSQDDIEEELKPYKDLFIFFQDAKSIKPETEFELPLSTEIESKKNKARVLYLPKTLLRAAAILIILSFSVWLFLPKLTPPKKNTINWEAYEIQDPALALEETRKVLALISGKFQQAEATTRKNLVELKRLDIVKPL